MTGDIVDMTGIRLSEAVRTREVSCADVMAAYLERVDRLNPAVNAIVSLRPRAELMRDAAERDRQLASDGPLGPLHGFPQAIKDLAPAAGIPNTQGSPIFRDTVPAADAIFVDRMRRAGAIIIGKTNVPEFGLGSNTFNSVFGTTLNAYDQSRTAGGSSGGAAVALALRMQVVADGSDHGGSLRNPAAYNNVFGFRTSPGRVPSEGRDVFLPPMGVIGPMARTVPDLAVLLEVMSGFDPRLPLSIRGAPGEFGGSLDRDLTGLRVGWLGDLGGHLPFETGILDLCRAGLGALEGLGCSVEEARIDFEPERIFQAWIRLRAAQAGPNLKELAADPARRALMKPEALYEVDLGASLSAYEVADAAAERTLWYAEVLRLFQRYDVLALPSAQVFPFPATLTWPREIAGRQMDTYHRWMEVVVPVTMSGCPALNVPVGFGPGGLPMGMQLVGPMHGERVCLEVAHAYDQATRWVERHPPPILDTNRG